jgi:hypothetical protein
VKVLVGNYPEYDEVEVDEKHEYMEFTDLPGRPKLTFNPDGTITVRTDASSHPLLIIKPEASNAFTFGMRK